MQQLGVGLQRLRRPLEGDAPSGDDHRFLGQSEGELGELLDQQHADTGLGDRLHDRHQPQEHHGGEPERHLVDEQDAGFRGEGAGEHDALLGMDWLSEAVFVDQSPIGKTARSNPASYVGAFDEIRKLFAQAPLAVERSYGAGMFSFNAGDGRCPTCGGSGFEHVEMQFLSDVYLRCPDCDGTRYRAEIREVKIERLGKPMSIADVLELTVADAVRLFAQDREVVRALQPLADVGLDYVKLGQPVPGTSGHVATAFCTSAGVSLSA